MHKLILLFSCLVFLSCNNQSSAPAASKDTAVKTTSSNAVNSWSKDDEMEFMAGCVDNAKALHGEQKAYVLCKCILGQVEQKYPAADSATMMAHLSDTAEVAKMAQKCK